MRKLTLMLGCLVCFLCGCGDGDREGVDSNSGYPQPQPVSPALTFAILESSGQHACGVTSDGNTYCWGSNEYGELGTTVAMEICKDPFRGSFPCTGTPRQVDSTLSFVALAGSMGSSSNCGLTAQGTAYCWGFGLGGQLGNGQRANHSTPVAVDGGHQFTTLRVAPSGLGVCGLTASGELYCWGPLGILYGQNQLDVSAIPIRVAAGYDFVDFDLGEQHACGITTSGQAYCWGDNWYGQLGIGTDGGAGGLAQATTPTAVIGGQVFKKIATGSNQTCALTEDGSAYCWGAGLSLGSGQTDGNIPEPQPVAGGHLYLSIHAGFIHTCGLTANGDAYCWGQNYEGELGDGTRITQLTPVKVDLPQGFANLSHRPYCGLAEGGQAYCWGGNAYGQVGRFPEFAD
jgi:alpha-tubulin suppressor-like RCC1 family protein